MTSEGARLEPDEIKHPRSRHGVVKKDATSNLRRFQAEQPAELPLGLEDAPLVRMQAKTRVQRLLEISALLTQLRPLEFTARIDKERRGGLSSGTPEVNVSSSRKDKTPQLDALDEDRDRQSQEYDANIWDALKALRRIARLEQKVLIPVHEADKYEAGLTSDTPACVDCGLTKEAYQRENKGGRWRLQKARCPACYMAHWRRREQEAEQFDAPT